MEGLPLAPFLWEAFEAVAVGSYSLHSLDVFCSSLHWLLESLFVLAEGRKMRKNGKKGMKGRFGGEGNFNSLANIGRKIGQQIVWQFKSVFFE
jgi:hypothetical protein